MPSALERNGDFSQTRNNAGVLRFIRNPFSAAALQREHRRRRLLPGQRHSAEHDPSDGPADLNLFPLPDPALVGNPVTQGEYNYQFAGDTEKLRRDNVVRVDWNIRPGTTFYTRFQTGKEVFGRGQFNADRTGPDRRRRHGLPVVGRQLRHQHHGLRRQRSRTRSRARPCSRSSPGPTGRSRTCIRWNSPTGMPSTIAITCPGTGSTSRRTTRITSCRT